MDSYLDDMTPFTYNRSTHPTAVPLALMPSLVTLSRSETEAEVYLGVMLISKLLSVESNAPIQEVIDSGVVDILVKCMTHRNVDLQFEASRALSNIASGNAARVNYIVSLNVVHLWIGHLSSGSTSCIDEALRALGNIASEGATYRDHVLEQGAMQPLLDLIRSCGGDRLEVLRRAVWALSNLCRSKPPVATITPAVSVLTNLIHHSDPEVGVTSLWVLSYIADGRGDGYLQLVINSGIVPLAVQLLAHPNREFHSPAVKVLSCVCAGTDIHRQMAINSGCLPLMAQLLLEPSIGQPTGSGVRLGVAQALSYIATGNLNQIQAILEMGLVPIIISMIGGTEAALREVAIRICANIAANANDRQIRYLVVCGTMESLGAVFTGSADENLLEVALEATQSILNNGGNEREETQGRLEGCIDAVKALTASSNPSIQSLAESIVSTYMDNTHEEEDE